MKGRFMSPAETLAAQVESATAQEFCAAVRNQTAPPGRSFLSALDDYFLDAHGPRGNLESTLRRHDIIEVQGPAGTGKTALFLFFTMTAVLPSTWTVTLYPPKGSSIAPRKDELVAVGGKGKAVAFLDCDGRSSAVRLRHILRSHLQRRVEATIASIPGTEGFEPSDDAYEEVLTACLGRVHVFSPTSSLGIAVTLDSLPAYHRQRCPRDDILYLFIDSMSAFYWQDCAKLEEPPRAAAQARARPRNVSNKEPADPSVADGGARPDIVRALPVVHPMAYVMRALASARRQLGCVTFLSNWTLHASPLPSASSASVPPRQHLVPPYPSPFVPSAPPPTLPSALDPLGGGPIQLTHHITLHPPSACAYPAGTSMQAAKNAYDERMRALNQRTIVATVRSASVGEQSSQGLVGKWSIMGTCEFGIRDSGLEAT